MYIEMNKNREDNSFVYYQFITKIYEQVNDQYELVSKKGCCKFSKQTDEFELIKNETDLYFYESREVMAVRSKLILRKRNYGDFPDILSVATG